MPKTILKSPEEYLQELELYKQLKKQVNIIYKTPEIERQQLIEQLKLEQESKASANKLIEEQLANVQPAIRPQVDVELFNDLNRLLNINTNIFTNANLISFTKNELQETKNILNEIKRVDSDKGETSKSRYIDSTINKIDRLLQEKKLKPIKPKPPSGPKPSVMRPKPPSKLPSKPKPSKSSSAESSVAISNQPLPQDILEVTESDAFKSRPQSYENLDEDTLKNYLNDIENSFALLNLKSNRNKMDTNTISNIKKKLRTRRLKLNNLLGMAVGRGLTKTKSKSKNNLGTQQQIYYILSKKSGNNNKLMKKRLKK